MDTVDVDISPHIGAITHVGDKGRERSCPIALNNDVMGFIENRLISPANSLDVLPIDEDRGNQGIGRVPRYASDYPADTCIACKGFNHNGL